MGEAGMADNAEPAGRGELESPEDIDDGRRQRFDPYALGCALGGFVALLGGQYLPWAHAVGTSADMSLGQFAPWLAVCYHVMLPFVLGGVGVALAAPHRMRRPVGAAAVGLVGGQLALLTTAARDIQGGTADGQVSAPPLSFAPGFSVAVLAALLLLAAAVRAAWPARRRHWSDMDSSGHGGDPLDLTVSPVEPAGLWAGAAAAPLDEAQPGRLTLRD
jgi:hypothetical protein